MSDTPRPGLPAALAARFRRAVTPAEVAAFLAPGPSRGTGFLWLLALVGVVLSPFTVLGAVLGFRRAYGRILEPQHVPPRLRPLEPATALGAAFGALLGFLVGLLATKVGRPFLFWLAGRFFGRDTEFNSFADVALGVSAVAFYLLPTVVIVVWFSRWLRQEQAYASESGRYGSARYASERETAEFASAAPLAGSGFFTGWHNARTLFYPEKGHFLTVGGTRSGKLVASIAPNLLLDSLRCSWVIIDPKGELAAVTARQLQRQGKNVIILNPWKLLEAEFAARGLTAFANFNPLSLLDTGSAVNLVDDVEILAEMIVPIPPGGTDTDHWTSRARSVVAGMMLHLVTSPAHKDERSLVTLWAWLRYPAPKLEALLVEMAGNDHPVAGPAVSGAGTSLGALLVGSGREFSSIMSAAQRYTEFLKSPALSASMRSSSFDLARLTDGNTAVFVVIPADRLKTGAQWLRLTVTAMMRSVIRRPGKRVTFLLDESYALGYVSEIETALGIAAGFNLSVWSIFQNLTQIQDLYGRNWENFLGSAAVRQFFGIGDQFSADYLSRFMGSSTIVDVTPDGRVKAVSARPLLTPDEVRRGSKGTMFTFIEQGFPVDVAKVSYRDVPPLLALADPNPYHDPMVTPGASTGSAA